MGTLYEFTNEELAAIPREVTEADLLAFEALLDVEPSPEELARVMQPRCSYPDQTETLALHWHPQHVPVDAVSKRVERLFPNSRDSLMIPTQHNEIMSLGGYSGVEIDCYCGAFNSKTHLLVHFKRDKEPFAQALRDICRDNFEVKALQVHEYLDSLIEPGFRGRLEGAAGAVCADAKLVEFITIQAKKLREILNSNDTQIPPSALGNYLVKGFFDLLRTHYGDMAIAKVQQVLRGVKQAMKRDFDGTSFHRIEDVIREARALGCGIIIPHPERSWPVLLADYDIDGFEVWNPNSNKYTAFLIDVITRMNRSRGPGARQLLLFMGDDTHMMEKTRNPLHKDAKKEEREVGLQPGWSEPGVKRRLDAAGVTRAEIIKQYRARLG